MTRIRFLSTFLLLFAAVLCLSGRLWAQIVSDADVPFTEESDSETEPPAKTAHSAESPDIEYVPASTVYDLNLPSPRFPLFQRLPGEQPYRIYRPGLNPLAMPPAFIRDVTVPPEYKTLVSDEYLYRIASTHPWGRFPEGSWKRIRVVRSEDSSDTANNAGNSHNSTAEHTITLSQVLPDKFSLTWESSLSTAGRKWNAAPKTTGSNYWEESADMKLVSFKAKSDLVLEIEGASYPCSWEHVVFENDSKRVEIKTWRSDISAHLPQILRQERKIYLKKQGEENRLSASSIYKLSPTSFPYSVMGKVHYVWKCEQTDESSQGKTVTSSLISLIVPGETVSFDTRQYSPQGELIGQTTGALMDYGFNCTNYRPDPIRSLFNNLRSWRRPGLLPIMPPIMGNRGM